MTEAERIGNVTHSVPFLLLDGDGREREKYADETLFCADCCFHNHVIIWLNIVEGVSFTSRHPHKFRYLGLAQSIFQADSLDSSPIGLDGLGLIVSATPPAVIRELGMLQTAQE